MGFSFRNLIRGKPEPEQSVESASRIEIADNPIENIMTEIYLRELAFQRAIQILAKMLGKCEIRTFLNGDEIFRDEYYTWNYEPNRNQNKQQFFEYIQKNFNIDGASQRLIWNILSYIEANYSEKNEQYNALCSLLDGTIGLEDTELNKVYM